jgi:hypothetical protein
MSKNKSHRGIAKMSPSKERREEELPGAMVDDETARNRASQRRSDDIERGKPMRGGRPSKPMRGE